jgi:sugar/nucleoside kinase (ribokinase family)
MNICAAAADLVWSRIFREFPDLRVALSEGGTGWIPYFLDRLDRTYDMHHAWTGQDFGDYRSWLESAGVDTSLVREIAGKFTASFFCSTDVDSNQIASFYTGAMANAGELSFRTAGECRLAIISPNDPGAMVRMLTSVGRSAFRLSSIPASNARGCLGTS